MIGSIIRPFQHLDFPTETHQIGPRKLNPFRVKLHFPQGLEEYDIAFASVVY